MNYHSEVMAMGELLRYVDGLRERFPIHVEVYYSKITDWVIQIYKKGCAEDYPGTDRAGDDAIMAYASSRDMEYCAAKAHVQLKDWLDNYAGGY